MLERVCVRECVYAYVSECVCVIAERSGKKSTRANLLLFSLTRLIMKSLRVFW